MDCINGNIVSWFLEMHAILCMMITVHMLQFRKMYIERKKTWKAYDLVNHINHIFNQLEHNEQIKL